MKRKEVPKKVKLTPRAPLVLIWDTMRVVTVELSTSGWGRTQRADPGRTPLAVRAPCGPQCSAGTRPPPTEARPAGRADRAGSPEQNQTRSRRMSTDMCSAPWAAELSMT